MFDFSRLSKNGKNGRNRIFFPPTNLLRGIGARDVNASNKVAGAEHNVNSWEPTRMRENVIPLTSVHICGARLTKQEWQHAESGAFQSVLVTSSYHSFA